MFLNSSENATNIRLNLLKKKSRILIENILNYIKLPSRNFKTWRISIKLCVEKSSLYNIYEIWSDIYSKSICNLHRKYLLVEALDTLTVFFKLRIRTWMYPW